MFVSVCEVSKHFPLTLYVHVLILLTEITYVLV